MTNSGTASSETDNQPGLNLRPRDFGLHEYGFELNRPRNRHERRKEASMKKTKKGKNKGKKW